MKILFPPFELLREAKALIGLADANNRINATALFWMAGKPTLMSPQVPATQLFCEAVARFGLVDANNRFNATFRHLMASKPTRRSLFFQPFNYSAKQ